MLIFTSYIVAANRPAADVGLATCRKEVHLSIVFEWRNQPNRDDVMSPKDRQPAQKHRFQISKLDFWTRFRRQIGRSAILSIQYFKIFKCDQKGFHQSLTVKFRIRAKSATSYQILEWNYLMEF
jgi:hypothetical protein